MRKPTRLLKFEGTEEEIAVIIRFMESCGLENFYTSSGSRNFESKAEIEKIQEIFEIGDHNDYRMTCSDIAGRLGFENLKNVGVALKKIGYKKMIMRIDGVPKNGYYVKVKSEERMKKFIKAQEDDLVVEGLRVRDFSCPEDFNDALRKLKMR